MDVNKMFNAPIPGENLTSNTKNYPWHKPPQYSDFDDAFEYLADDIFADKEKMASIITLVSSGISAVALVQMLLINKVSTGRISPDMSLLIAGPFYKVLVRLLDAMGVEYMTGFDTTEELKAYAEKLKGGGILLKSKKAPKLTDKQMKEMEEITEEVMEEIPVGGLMGAPTEEVE